MDFERATPVKRNSLNSWITSPRTYKKANKQISSYWTLLRLLTKSGINYFLFVGYSEYCAFIRVEFHAPFIFPMSQLI
jgi:hypothetical protein